MPLSRPWLIALVALGLSGLAVGARGTISRIAARRSVSAARSAAPPAGSIAGRVTGDRASAVAGARVCAVLATDDPLEDRPAHCVDADAEGRYAISSIPSGRYRVSASAPAFMLTSARDGEAIAVTAAPAEGIDFALPRGDDGVKGVVLDARAGAVAGASVRIDRVLGGPRASVEVRADEQGRFSFAVAPGRVRLSAHGEGYAEARWVGFAPREGVRLVLSPGATVRGVVASAAAASPAAVSGMAVRLFPFNHRTRAVGTAAISAAGGNFEIRGVEPGTYSAVAVGDGQRGETAGPIHVGVAGVVDGVRVDVHPAPPVVGRVELTEDAKPCERGTVHLGAPDPAQAYDEWSGGRPPPSGPDLVTDIGVGGAVRFPAVEPGRYFVAVQCPGHLLKEGPRVLDVGKNAPAPALWKVSPGLSLAFDVVDGLGRPVARAPFTMRVTANGRGILSMDDTDEQGRYAVKGTLYPGTVEIRAEPPFAAAPVVLPIHEGGVDASARLQLAGAGAIEIAVRDPSGGAIDGVIVRAIGAGASSQGLLQAAAGFPATSLGRGVYRIAPLTSGRYRVVVDDGMNPTTEVGELPLADGAERRETVVLDRRGLLRGRVVDANGSAVAGVWVAATAQGRAPSEEQELRRAMLQVEESGARALTDVEGRFVIDRLWSGDTRYAVHLERAGAGEGSRIDARADGSEISLIVPPAGAAGDSFARAAPMATRP
jgi:hypothetical protein